MPKKISKEELVALDTTLNAKEQAETNAHLRAKIKELGAQLKTYQTAEGFFKEFSDRMVEAIPALDLYPRVAYKAGEQSSSPIYAVDMVSDWQIGEVINAAETEGFGEFDWEIAKKRMLQFTEKTLDWTNMHRHSFQIDELHILSLSDHVSGNIHYELEVTNEFPLPVAVVKAGWLLAEYVSRKAAQFKVVHIWELSLDNHGRLTRKSQSKQGAKNNMSYLVHKFANVSLAKHIEKGRVVVHELDGAKGLAKVGGWNFLLQHGHQIMGQMGIPYYGFNRAKGREAIKRMEAMQRFQEDIGFDYMALGHWHVPAIIDQNILVNGCLTGTTEFDHGQGRHAPPSQVSFLVHPKHGMFDWTAWKFKAGEVSWNSELPEPE